MPYKLQIWYSGGFLLTSFVHLSCIFKAITKQLYTTTKVPFSLHFSFLIDLSQFDSESLYLRLPHSIQQDTSDLCVYLVVANWHPPACVLEEKS